MLSSGSSPLTVMRDSMWGFLLFAGVAWLAIAWSVLRLEPSDVVSVAGPVLMFGALCEGVRALVGAKTWWLNAGMAALFAATAVVMLVSRDSSYTTPASLIGWFLLVRGAVDVAVSTMNRGTDRTWGLVVMLGVVQAGLGFFSASAYARTGDLVIVSLGALGLLRAVADLVTALRLREITAVRHEVLRLPPERAAGVAGYAAGLTDFDAAPARHRAGSAAAGSGAAEPVPSFHDEVVRTTAELDSMIAQAGVTGISTAAHRVPDGLPRAPDTLAGVHEDAAAIAQEYRKHEREAGMADRSLSAGHDRLR
ncbi:hypothetical protein ACWKSP_22830 [Micromonosporaceae bacterium Da 78-11]